jgi:peptide/nickel transport system ATP-binding protein
MGRAEAKAWMLELFKALDLPDPEHFGNRYPHQVSGGQLQRAMVAMAMSCRPDILVLRRTDHGARRHHPDRGAGADAPAAIQRYDTAALYITHDLAVVAQIADRIMVLRHGKMVELGPTEQVLEGTARGLHPRLVGERQGSLPGEPRRHEGAELCGSTASPPPITRCRCWTMSR